MLLYIGTKPCSGRSPRYYILNIDDITLESRMVYRSKAHEPVNQFHWGFAWDNDRLYIPNGDKGIVEYDNLLQEQASYPVRKFKGVKLKQEAEDDVGRVFNRPHQNLKIGRNIYIVDTAHNEIKIFNIDSKEVKYKTMSGFTWVNCINYIDGYLYLISHNSGEPSQLIKADLDLNTLEVTDKIGYANHNIWKMNGKIWTCNSKEGYIQSIDGEESVFIGQFVRGVAMNKNHLLLAVTRNRSSNIKYECNPPITNGNFECGIAILNSKTLEFEKFVDIKKMVKKSLNLFEIRLLDERDYAAHLDDDNKPLSLDIL